MRSPFPGMDPYLEGPDQWQDFHSTYVHALREAVADALPGNYFARIQEDVLLLEPGGLSGRRIEPDVYVARTRDTAGSTAPAASTATATLELAPTTLENIEYLDPHVEPFVEVLHLPGREVVAVIELLSPTNKASDGRALYMRKRLGLLGGPIHLVELDLLRAGRRLELNRPLPPAHYYGFVSRADRKPKCDVYHWSVRQRLPAIPIPLRAPDPDVRVDLQQAFRVAYERGRYGRLIDYAQAPPAPAFGPGDAEWVAATAVAPAA